MLTEAPFCRLVLQVKPRVPLRGGGRVGVNPDLPGGGSPAQTLSDLEAEPLNLWQQIECGWEASAL